MRYIRARQGPVRRQPFFNLTEIEEICTAELRKFDLLPKNPEPIRIDRLIEKKYGNIIEYETLEERVLGFTCFGPKGVSGIVIEKSLDETDSISDARRLRTTLAHECGHCLLHGHLFINTKVSDGLFGEEMRGKPKILCRDIVGIPAVTGQKKYDGHWWEFQANKAMGMLLLPSVLINKAIQPFLTSSRLSEVGRAKAVEVLAEQFDVNPIVIRIRLAELFGE